MENEKSRFSDKSLLTLPCLDPILSILLKLAILYPAPTVNCLLDASTIWPADVLSVRVLESRYSRLNVILLFNVALSPMSGANFSVMATDDMLNGDDGIGLCVCSSRVKPILPSTPIQFR